MQDWNGEGYTLKLPYTDGAEVRTPDPDWVYARSKAAHLPAVRESREYRQALGPMVNSLLGLGFTLQHLSDSRDFCPDPHAAPGTWDHLVLVAPPWLAFWFRYQPKE